MSTNNQSSASNKQIRVRFAPSPTGNLHIGSARTALFNWLFAKKNKGTFILRIEDTDNQRSTKEFEQAIIKDLLWLGLDFDECPGKGDFGPYHQSERFSIYRQKAKQLLSEKKAYYCYCTPEELQVEKEKALAQGRPPRYSGRCKKLLKKEIKTFIAEGRKPSIRFEVKRGELTVEDKIRENVHFSLDDISDFIILRPDGSPTFHLAVVVDDASMKITHIIRGEDHLSNTPKHILLFEALGYEAPKFAHIPIILGRDKTKLSKRHGSTAIFEFSRKGYLPSSVVNYLSLLSWSPPNEEEVLSLNELINLFDIENVSKSPAIFDLDKLKWLNGQHIRRLSKEKLASLIKPYLKDKNMVVDEKRLVLIAEAIKEDLVTLDEAGDYAQVFLADKISYADNAQDYLKEEVAKQTMTNFKELFTKKAPADFTEAKELLKEHSLKLKPLGIKGKNAFMPLRLALSGSYSGPEIFYLITIIEKERVLKFLDKALKLR